MITFLVIAYPVMRNDSISATTKRLFFWKKMRCPEETSPIVPIWP